MSWCLITASIHAGFGKATQSYTNETWAQCIWNDAEFSNNLPVSKDSRSDSSSPKNKTPIGKPTYHKMPPFTIRIIVAAVASVIWLCKKVLVLVVSLAIWSSKKLLVASAINQCELVEG
mmetsp:Transcript_40548/g.74158  ORF Transcript_40548/g.74158 Transcript_40548/m.74158 type:complete len:119 (+) Transcript_40548:844-1200(+)